MIHLCRRVRNGYKTVFNIIVSNVIWTFIRLCCCRVKSSSQNTFLGCRRRGTFHFLQAIGQILLMRSLGATEMYTSSQGKSVKDMVMMVNSIVIFDV